MKTFQIIRFITAGLMFGLGLKASAQSADGPVGVAVTIKGLDLSWSYYGSGSEYLDVNISGLNGYQSVSAGLYDSETPQLTARLEPGKAYFLNVSSDSLDNLTIQAVPPPGYVMEIERASRERITVGSGYANLRVRVLAPMQQYNARAGAATALTSGRIYWQVALGSLANGSSAGSLAIIDTGAGNFTSLFTPAGLQYEPVSSEVSVFYNPWWVSAPEVPGAIRQIIAPQACVDIITVATNETHIKFYHRSQLQATPATGLRAFTGDPYAWYLINQDGAQPNKVFINCDLRNLPTPTSAGVPVVQVKHTVLERTGTAPNFTWTADEWYDDGYSSLSREVHVRSGSSESITIAQPGGATATSISRTYGSVPWGEEIVSETHGTTDAVTTSTEFYTSSAQAGNYGRPKSMLSTGGAWEAYEYYDYAGGTADEAGALYRSHRPWLNSDTSVPSNLGSHGGVITTFTYATDAFGRRSRPATEETTIGGVTVAKTSITYSDAASGFTGHPYLYLVTATNNAYASAGSTLTTINKYFREDAGAFGGYLADDFFRGQVHSIQYPDGRKQSFVYQRGTWSGGSSFSLSGNNGTDYGAASRISVINGTTTYTSSQCTSYAGYDVDDLYLVDGKSTMEVTIRDASALVRRTETHVWSSGAWQLVSFMEYGYDYSNQVTSRTTSNGGLFEAAYTGEHKDWEKDDSGIRVDYTYDAAGRVHTATKSSGPISTYAYDAEQRTLSETITGAGTGESIYSARTYDDAGRLRTELPVGMSTVSYTYNVSGRTRTATYPDNSTRTEAFFADGQLDSVAGSAVVAEYHGYTIESDGRRTTQVWSGFSGSPRWQKGTTDWLGRGLHLERPGFSISGQAATNEDYTYESGTGRLVKTARTGYAPQRYEYDALSNLVRSGLDIGDNGLIDASADRINEHNQFFEYASGAWWLREESKTYPKLNDPTSVTTSITRKRLTGHPVNRLDETQVTDVEGNTLTRTVDINRDTATATITTTRPGMANSRVETIVNGLSTSTTGHDGLSSTTQYDALSRIWKTTDPRNNTFTTTYKYGTGMVQSVTDGTGINQGTASYNSMGRQEWIQNNAGKYTRFEYNPRGQVVHQWGDGSYPVSFDYDATYGEQTGMSTYRDMSTADSGGWPGGGTADNTTWTYDPATGFLWKKTDAGNQVTEFDYNVRGQTSARKWARSLVSNGSVRLTSTYGYDGNTGELTSVSYNDDNDPIPTPDVTYGAYTRLGQPTTVTDGTGTRTFNYNSSSPWRMDNESLGSGFYASRVLTRQFDGASGIGGNYGPYTPGFIKGRYIGYDLGVSGNAARDQHVAYTTSNLARFVGVNTRVSTGSARDYVYSYTSSSALLSGYNMGPFFGVSRTYETQRDVLSKIEGWWGGSAVTRYEYSVNALGQRTTAKQSGTAFGDYATAGYSGTYNVYTYNARGELETSARYRGDTATTSPAAADELPGRRFEYRYDSIGNRKTSGATGTASDDGYATNTLNQYTARDNKSVKVLGTADQNAPVVVSGAATAKVDRAWGAEITPGNTGGPAQGTATVYAAKVGQGAGGTDFIQTDGKAWFAPARSQSLGYDADGNLTSDGVWTYTYNAENQLVRMASVLPAGFTGRHLLIDFKYDYQGRRVEKRTYDNDTSSETFSRRFVYDGWNLIAETDLSGNLKRTYTWGLDLAGSLSATGGVGALLQIDDLVAGKTMAPTYDGNGNVASLINVGTGALEATYEYDPFGNLLRCEGAYAKTNPFRFSTKWQDDESGLINYGVRYYSPTLGRFINRDPIAEKGGLNLYGFCGNDGVNHWDYLGQSWLSKIWNRFRHTIISAILYAIPGVGPVLSTMYNAAVGAYYGGIKGMVSALAGGGYMGPYMAAAAKVYGLYQQFGHGKFLNNVGNFMANRLVWNTTYHAANELFDTGSEPMQVKPGEGEKEVDTSKMTQITPKDDDPSTGFKGERGFSGLILAKQNQTSGKWEYFTTDKILTKYVFVNGIVGTLARHLTLMEKHLDSEYKGLTQYTLMNNPTHGGVSDILEATLDILGIPSRPARVLAAELKDALGRGIKPVVVGHSQGGAILTEALRILQMSGTKADGMTVIYHAAASNTLYASSVARSLGISFGGHAYSSYDAVGTLAGMNANVFQIIPALLGVPSLFGKPTVSPHSEPNAVAKYPWRVWYPATP